MFSCRRCLRQALRAVIAESRQRLLSNTSKPQPFVSARSFSAPRVVEPTAKLVPRRRDDRFDASESSERQEDRSAPKSTDKEETDDESRSLLQEIRSPSEAQRKSATSSALRELPWIKDPYKLAEDVRRKLQSKRERKFLNALALVRLASARMPEGACVVSWNHLVDYLISNGPVEAAIRVYNEMKKRAQFPDSRTYAILIRGLAKNARVELAKSSALKLYHSMFHETSRVKPTILHTNAALNVCANAKDMDAIWGIVSRLPETGPNAPDTITYTTILKALRANATPESDNAQIPVRSRDRTGSASQGSEEAIAQGRKIWLNVIKRWRHAQICIDENLMCAMGELLMTSPAEHDIDDVFSLVEQVTKVPRQTPRIETETRNQADQAAGFAEMPHEAMADEETSFVPAKADERSEIDPFGDGVPLPPVKDPREHKLWVVPGNHTLSLLLKACLILGRGRAGQLYWNALAKPRDTFIVSGVKPDLSNYLDYLRLLRMSRSSGLALQTLSDIEANVAPAALPAKVFRIALPTCTRNGQSPNAMREAVDMYRMMLRHLPYPVFNVMHHMAKLACVHPDTPSVVEALRLVLTCSNAAPPDRGVDNAWRVDKFKSVPMVIAERHDDDRVTRQSIVLLAQNVTSAIDRLLKTDQILRNERLSLESGKAAMSYLVEKFRGSVVKRRAPSRRLGNARVTKADEKRDVDSMPSLQEATGVQPSDRSGKASAKKPVGGRAIRVDMPKMQHKADFSPVARGSSRAAGGLGTLSVVSAERLYAAVRNPRIEQ